MRVLLKMGLGGGLARVILSGINNHFISTFFVSSFLRVLLIMHLMLLRGKYHVCNKYILVTLGLFQISVLTSELQVLKRIWPV